MQYDENKKLLYDVQAYKDRVDKYKLELHEMKKTL
jgi:hypothetical protein